MYLFRNSLANTIAQNNANLLSAISCARRKTLDSKIKAILKDCSHVISLLNEGKVDDANIHKELLSKSEYYSRRLANTIFDSSREIYQLISRTLKAFPLDKENCHDIEILKEGYLRPRSP